MLSRYEVPFGVDTAADGNAIYPFSSLSTITFTSGSSGTFSSLDVNANYRSDSAPEIALWWSAKDVPFTVEAMIDGLTGISGGYLLKTEAYVASIFSASTGEIIEGATQSVPAFKLHVFPSNNGRTLLFQGGDYPFTGVCQF